MSAFERPWALVALALPALVWWLASRAAHAPRSPTGTVPIWREVAREETLARARRATPLALLALLAALTLGVLALAGPRARAAGSATWRVVVDRSPSMYLADAGATRFAHALERAQALLRGVAADGDEFVWSATDGTFVEEQRGAAPPSAWFTAPRAPQRAPRFELFDATGTLWVTDHTPAPAPRRAGWCASGGAATEASAPSSDVPNAHWDTALDAAPLVRAFEAWRAARGVQTNADGSALDVVALRDGEAFEVSAGRDGWSLRGRAREVPASSADASETWLAGERGDGAAFDVVRSQAGRIEIGFEGALELTGDPAAFAVSWARLFDAALLPPRGGVSFDERRAAGAPSERAPQRGAAAPDAGGNVLPAGLAAASALLALAALALRR